MVEFVYMYLARYFAPAALLAVACHSPGLYGHAPKYAPLAAEESALAGAKELSAEGARKKPEDYQKTPGWFFGVVVHRVPGPAGAAYLTLSVRKLEADNLCGKKDDEDTCRVTVSDAEFGVVHAVLTLHGEDDTGPTAVAPGSLLRLVGPLASGSDKEDGAPIMRPTYFRHFPPHTYATKAAGEGAKPAP